MFHNERDINEYMSYIDHDTNTERWKIVDSGEDSVSKLGEDRYDKDIYDLDQFSPYHENGTPSSSPNPSDVGRSDEYQQFLENCTNDFVGTITDTEYMESFIQHL